MMIMFVALKGCKNKNAQGSGDGAQKLDFEFKSLGALMKRFHPTNPGSMQSTLR